MIKLTGYEANDEINHLLSPYIANIISILMLTL